MAKLTALLLSLFITPGCMVVPQVDTTKVSRCEISSDRKTLRIYDGHKDAGTYYSISGLVLVPITGVISGTYVAINNIYNFGEERIVSGPASDTKSDLYTSNRK
jgi:hypothetical protein